MISISNIKKEYKGIAVVDIPGLHVAKGECFGLVGNNGAGKTTLFRLLLDLVQPTTGQITINEIDVSREDKWKRSVRAFLDDGFIVPYLTPDEFFTFVGELYGYGTEDMKLFLDRFQEFFNQEIIGKKKYIRDLSSGNVKKIGIVASLVGQPEVVILDEPFENLDPTSQIRLKDIVVRENQVNGTTFLISSHDLNHVTEICNRIVVMEKGKIVNDLAGGPQALAALEEYFNLHDTKTSHATETLTR